MQKEILLRGKKVAYRLNMSNRTRRMRITVYCEGGVTLTAPQGCTLSKTERFIQAKADWILKKLAYFKKLGSRFVDLPKAMPSAWRQYKGRALQLAQERVRYFNRLYGFAYKRISIRNQKTRWGSCSRKGNLNFNYRIVLLPGPVTDYLIVHELCHLQELNHSPTFWALVAKAIPEYKTLKKELLQCPLRDEEWP